MGYGHQRRPPGRTTPRWPISAAARIPKTSFVAVGTRDGVIALLGADGTLSSTLGREGSGVLNLAAGAGQRVFAVLDDGHVAAYDAQNRTRLWNRELGPSLAGAGVGPDSVAYDTRRHRLAVGFVGGYVRLLDPATGETRQSITVDGQPSPSSVAFDPGSGLLIAGARDGTLR